MTAITRRDAPAGAGSTWRRRPVVITAAITLTCLGLFADLLLVGHTVGEEIWGVLVAAFGAGVGALSLLYLATARTSRPARLVLLVLWATLAFFGFGGYNDHRLPLSPDTISEQRPRPPLAPLAFTALGIAGLVTLRSGARAAHETAGHVDVADPDIRTHSESIA